ncbi:Uncharacterized protein HSBGL_4129 (plasmid) [Halapricum desulfuricans]|uniref:Uncharacterized protein n=1 Tax=Halapricum desulfuricans TaxID=2841257 RepID=A0A897NRU2_9EURY|nr:hypothetical protein [Halapricum desulfuricans]QSG13543.1 Uncharacterized protein HSBGL_4129 [Halapricum desulfuricans]
MKKGSTDDPFADDEEEADNEPEQPESERSELNSSATSESLTAAQSTTQRQSLPYIHSRDGVKDGRKQRPVFLREHIEDGIDDLVDQMESEFGEDVYKTDVTEAAMAVAQEHPELVLEKLEEWGYGWS